MKNNWLKAIYFIIIICSGSIITAITGCITPSKNCNNDIRYTDTTPVFGLANYRISHFYKSLVFDSLIIINHPECKVERFVINLFSLEMDSITYIKTDELNNEGSAFLSENKKKLELLKRYDKITFTKIEYICGGNKRVYSGNYTVLVPSNPDGTH